MMPLGINPGRRTLAVLAGGVLLLVTLVTYLPAVDGQFLWDDDMHVTAPELRSLSGLWRIWTDLRVTEQYYPLTHSAFWLEYRLWGVNPVGYHVVNVVLHVMGALLLCGILTCLAIPGAWLGAAIFALHPTHVESVAWITEFKNTLSGVFYLGALLTYLSFDPPGSPLLAKGRKRVVTEARDWRLYGVALGLFVCALLSKTATVSLPAAILLIHWWKASRLGWRRHVLPLLPFFVLGVTLGLVTAWVERYHVGAEGEEFAFTWVDRGLIAGRALWFYVGKLLWPADLIFIYPRWNIDRSAWWQYMYPAAALAVLVALVALRGRLGRGPLVAALFFGGTLAPALGFFFDIYAFRYSFVADHFQYLASLGLITLAAALIATGLTRLGMPLRAAGQALCGALLLALATLSWHQAHLYKEPEILYRDIIARNPGSAMAYANLACHYWQQGRNAEAFELIRTLIALRPDYAPAYAQLGGFYDKQGRLADALAAYRAALSVNPRFLDVYNELGRFYRKQGLLAEAIATYQAAITIKPDFATAYNNLGTVYHAQGKYPEAIAAWEHAVRLDPNSMAGRAAHANIENVRAQRAR